MIRQCQWYSYELTEIPGFLMLNAINLEGGDRITAETKQKQYPAVDVTGDTSKVRCCKEQYCIGTWKVRSMNQGKWKW